METEFDYAIHALMKQLPISSNKLHQIQRATKEDITLAQVVTYCRNGLTVEMVGQINVEYRFRLFLILKLDIAQVVTYCRNGWPDKCRIPIQVIPYFKIRHQLNVHENLLLLDNKIIVPAVLRKEMLTKIHVAHQGIEKTKARARQVFYWPGINSEIENMIKSCRVCEKFSNKNRREPLNVYELPERPWQRLAADIFSYGNHSFLVVMDAYSNWLADIFSYGNHSFLVVMDAYSNWLEVVKIQSKSTEEVIRKFMSIFSKFGCPDTLVCDNIPFGSEKMKAFAREWNFNIVTRSPNYPRSNGLGEKAVARSPNYPRSNGLGEKAVGIAKKMVKHYKKSELPKV
ncbi:Integrase zinc binding domain [Popillia japonica]|uniref:RNA-directed DNA polymerase n=1 Tax=Popillia japonica TaxID=7064 RepID=A0AAW1JYK4_POPJA